MVFPSVLNFVCAITEFAVLMLLLYFVVYMVKLLSHTFKSNKLKLKELENLRLLVDFNEVATKKIRELRLWYECDNAKVLTNAVLLAHYCEEKRQQGYEVKVVSTKADAETIEFPLK